MLHPFFLQLLTVINIANGVFAILCQNPYTQVISSLSKALVSKHLVA